MAQHDDVMEATTENGHTDHSAECAFSVANSRLLVAESQLQCQQNETQGMQRFVLLALLFSFLLRLSRFQQSDSVLPVPMTEGLYVNGTFDPSTWDGLGVGSSNGYSNVSIPPSSAPFLDTIPQSQAIIVTPKKPDLVHTAKSPSMLKDILLPLEILVWILPAHYVIKMPTRWLFPILRRGIATLLSKRSVVVAAGGGRRSSLLLSWHNSKHIISLGRRYLQRMLQNLGKTIRRLFRNRSNLSTLTDYTWYVGINSSSSEPSQRMDLASQESKEEPAED